MQNTRSSPASHTVCIIIAAYNAQETIERAVKSALAENEVTEIVVVDDASSDSTAAKARSCDDGSGRLKILVQPINSGPSAARNRAMNESNAVWIGILDADDFFLPGRIKTLLAYTEQADFIADNMWQVSEGHINGPRTSLMNETVKSPLTINFSDFVQSNVTRAGRSRGELGFIKPLMRSDFLNEHGIHYQEHMRLGEDYELYARALALGARLILIPQKGYVSVVRPDSLSGQHSENDLLSLRECDNELAANLTLNDEQKHALRQHYLSIDCRLQWRLLINAVKKRDIRAAIQSFLRPYPVPAYLIKQLASEVYLRSFGLKGKSSP